MTSRGPRPLDLQHVAARVDAGVYSAIPGGPSAAVAAFVADVSACCAVWRAAAKRSNTQLGASLQEAGGAALPDLVEAKLHKMVAGAGRGEGCWARGGGWGGPGTGRGTARR